MSLQTDAETLRDLAQKIVDFEVAKAQLGRDNSVVILYDNPNLTVTLTNAQKQAALAQEATWQASAKAITAPW